MKKIKTIYHKNVDDFDVEINNEIEEGWTLVWRSAQVYNGEPHFFAGLEKEIVTENEVDDENVRKIMRAERRDCFNCKHYAKHVRDEPCLHCANGGGQYDKWEAVK